MLTYQWPKISSDFICIYETIAGSWDSAPDPTGGTHDTSPDPEVRPSARRLVHVALAPYDSRVRAFGARPRLRCPNYGHLNVFCVVSGKMLNILAATMTSTLRWSCSALYDVLS